MNEFLKAENKGRLLFKSFLDLIGATGLPTEDTYDRVDYYFQINGKKAVVEIKVRNAYYSDFMIEADKLLALLDAKALEGLNKAYYVCFYKNQMYIYTTEAIIKYGRRGTPNCKNSTVAFTGYVPKEVLYVPNDKASRFDLVNGLWHKSNPTLP